MHPSIGPQAGPSAKICLKGGGEGLKMSSLGAPSNAPERLSKLFL